MYQVQFISTGISAFSSTDRGMCSYWLEQNNYEPDKIHFDNKTGEMSWIRGECLHLFKLVKVKNTMKEG